MNLLLTIKRYRKQNDKSIINMYKIYSVYIIHLHDRNISLKEALILLLWRYIGREVGFPGWRTPEG